jgi:hypothetical protein
VQSSQYCECPPSIPDRSLDYMTPPLHLQMAQPASLRRPATALRRSDTRRRRTLDGVVNEHDPEDAPDAEHPVTRSGVDAPMPVDVAGALENATEATSSLRSPHASSTETSAPPGVHGTSSE